MTSLVPATVERERELAAPLEQAANLPEGSLSIVGLVLTDIDMPYERWEQIGVLIGTAHRWSQFALGDWLNFGEQIFGEKAAQATEATMKDRYDVARRATGLAHRTLVNYASVCSRIAVSRRHPALTLSQHEPVAALPADEQREWLERAVENGWDRDEIRNQIALAKTGVSEPPEPPPVPSGRYDRVLEAARHCYHQAELSDDGTAIVPAEPWARLVEAIGEE